MDHQSFLRNLSTKPGVYLMYDDKGSIIYIGKAKNLKNRLSSYFRANPEEEKVRQLVEQMAHIEVTITPTEIDALILENVLIKKNKPKFNIQYKDDKGYPYISISTEHPFPGIYYYRGKTLPKKMTFFGPYLNSKSVYNTLELVQKLFRIRTCEDSYFENRSRPCLQYQIGRCSAPCVGNIDQKNYKENVRMASLLLNGKNESVIDELKEKMNQASRNLDFENATKYRNLISSIRMLLKEQIVVQTEGERDILAAYEEAGTICIHVLNIRNGQMVGSKNFFPKNKLNYSLSEVLNAFLPQYYLNDKNDQYSIPKEIIIDRKLPEEEWITKTLTQLKNQKVKIITVPIKGKKSNWMTMATESARQACIQEIQSKISNSNFSIDLQQFLPIQKPPLRIECFDISHLSGESTIASCVVWTQENGMDKKQYRRYIIQSIAKGDDIQALTKAIEIRFLRQNSHSKPLPDLLIIDGGIGQLRAVYEKLKSINLQNIPLLGIAKGKLRIVGKEKIYWGISNKALLIDRTSRTFKMLLYIRDEAHRFALVTQQRRTRKIRQTSSLEMIPGVGMLKRKAILQYFGGLQGVQQASLKELAQVPGIGQKLASIIHQTLHC